MSVLDTEVVWPILFSISLKILKHTKTHFKQMFEHGNSRKIKTQSKLFHFELGSSL